MGESGGTQCWGTLLAGPQLLFPVGCYLSSMAVGDVWWLQGQGFLPLVPPTLGAAGTGIVLLGRDEGKGAFLGMGQG